jgi:hypothetical protein
MDSEVREREIFLTQWFSDWTRQPTKHEIHKADRAFKQKQLINKQNSMQVTGNIKLIGETQTFDSGFTKRLLVVTTNDMYPQDIPIDFVKESVLRLDDFKVGQNVIVYINLRGNEHNGKYYLSASAWKIEGIQTATSDNDLPG